MVTTLQNCGYMLHNFANILVVWFS